MTLLSPEVRQPGITTHCPHGHELTPENTYVGPKLDRRCRECAREYRRKARAAAKRYEMPGVDYTDLPALVLALMQRLAAKGDA